MRIHTSAYSQTIRNAAREAGAELFRLDPFRSRSHDYGYDVILTGDSPRYPNGGRYGRGGVDDHAASWDQWGIFLAAIYRVDSKARMGGTAKRPGYADAEDFAWQTFDRFGFWQDGVCTCPRSETLSLHDPECPVPTGGRFVATGRPGTYHTNHKWVFTQVGRFHCGYERCSAVRRWRY